MSQAARIRPEVLSDNANRIVCSTLRRSIQALMNSPVFTRYERVRANLNLARCTDAGQLQRYYAGVLSEQKQREEAAGLSANYEPAQEPDDWRTAIAANDAAYQRELDACDREAA